MAARAAKPTPSVHTLDVRLGDTLVGTLVHLGNEDLLFTFDKDYVERADTRPTLSLSFKAADGGLVERARPTHVRLPPFFANLLPEAHLRTYLAARGGVHPDREFFLLWLLGHDLPGAITVRASDGSRPAREDDDTSRAKRGEAPMRFSLAGVQLKFSALQESPGGLTLPVDGTGGDWIVKLPSPRFAEVPQNEYAMMTLARAVGIDVPDVQLVDTQTIGGLPAHLPEAFAQSLAVCRFDRPHTGERVHIEDFAQVFGVYPEMKYKRASYGNIARVLWLETGQSGVVEFTRRLVFNTMIGNADAHLKNWSLIYQDGRTPTLAPAYDLVSTIAYLPDDSLALSLGGTKHFDDVDIERFRHMADKAGLPVRLVVETARDTTARIRDLWPSHEPARSLKPAVRQSIDAHMQSVPLV